jgi:hypothetical protein
MMTKKRRMKRRKVRKTRRTIGGGASSSISFPLLRLELTVYHYSPTRRNTKSYYDIPKEPQAPGILLEQSGAFGPPPRKYDTALSSSWTRPGNVAEHFRMRELDYRAPQKTAMGDLMIPNSAGVEVAQLTSKVYSGQYSSDGRFFYSCTPSLPGLLPFHG